MRGELVELWDDELVKRSETIFVAGAGLEGNIHREPASRTAADFPFVAGAGVAGARVLVKRDEENGGVILERGLRAVAVMDVEIDDGDLADAVHLLEVTGGDGDV